MCAHCLFPIVPDPESGFFFLWCKCREDFFIFWLHHHNHLKTTKKFQKILLKWKSLINESHTKNILKPKICVIFHFHVKICFYYNRFYYSLICFNYSLFTTKNAANKPRIFAPNFAFVITTLFAAKFAYY